jgi:hypothetical protein
VGLTQRQDLPAVEALFSMIEVLQREERISPSDLRVRFVGHNGHLVQAVAAGHGVTPFLELSPAVPHREAMQAMARADCLFYMQTPFGTRRRLTEYLGARRPILAYPDVPGSFADRLLRSSGAGRIARDPATLRRHLAEVVQEHKSLGRLQVQLNESVVRSHSAAQRAGELVQILGRYVPRLRTNVTAVTGPDGPRPIAREPEA